MPRKLEVKMEATSGNITMFLAFLNGNLVIADDGSKARSWKDDIPDGQVLLKTRVIGIDNATYKLSIDLPGTAKDQALELQLTGGYHEIEILL
jgi:hypothetical protein